jgi:hypothetical protein
VEKLLSSISELEEENGRLQGTAQGSDKRTVHFAEEPEEADTSRGQVSAIGQDASTLTRRHNAKGKHRKTPSENTFITVGATTAHIPALEAVYGKRLCPAALCSMKGGVSRLRVCDRKTDARHLRIDSAAHRLPVHSGPKDKRNWARVEKLTNAALEAEQE